MRRCSRAGRRSSRARTTAAAARGGDPVGIVAVGGEVADPRAARRGRDPAGRRGHRDAQAVVLADEQQRQRQALRHAVAGGVEGAGGRGVVERGVAEAADGHRVAAARPRAARAGGPGRWRRRRRPRGAGARRSWTSAGSPRGWRRRRPCAARPRPGRRSRRPCPAAPRAAPRRAAGRPAARAEEERAGAVVQQRRIGRAQRRGDQGVRLVPGRADRVVAAALLAHPAGVDVEQPAARHRVEQAQQPRFGPPVRGQRAQSVTDGGVEDVVCTGRAGCGGGSHGADHPAPRRGCAVGVPARGVSPLYITNLYSDAMNTGTPAAPDLEQVAGTIDRLSIWLRRQAPAAVSTRRSPRWTRSTPRGRCASPNSPRGRR